MRAIRSFGVYAGAKNFWRETMIQHTSVSYYGFNYVEYAEKDFIEMKQHGCDTVILAITEFDMDFWFPNINAIIKKAHEMGVVEFRINHILESILFTGCD